MTVDNAREAMCGSRRPAWAGANLPGLFIERDERRMSPADVVGVGGPIAGYTAAW